MIFPVNPAISNRVREPRYEGVGQVAHANMGQSQTPPMEEARPSDSARAVRYSGWTMEPYVLIGMQAIEKDARAIADVFHFLAETEREWTSQLSLTLRLGSWQELLPRVSDYLERIKREMETAWDQLHLPSRTEGLLPIQKETEQAVSGLSEAVGKQLHEVGVEIVVKAEGMGVQMDTPHFLQTARDYPERLAATLDGAAMVFDAVAEQVHQEALEALGVIERPADWGERLG